MATRVQIDPQQTQDFCRRNHIRKLALFGSVLRDDFGPDSDVDVLVEFEPGHVPGLAFLSMEQELSKDRGSKSRPQHPSFLSPYLRDRVLSEAEVQSVEA